MSLDGYTIGIKREGTTNILIHLDTTLKEAAIMGNDGIEGEELLKIDNPLEQHIVAALIKEPIVDPKRTQQSQYFLEQAHGYKP